MWKKIDGLKKLTAPLKVAINSPLKSHMIGA
jgi:hypothetical protein